MKKRFLRTACYTMAAAVLLCFWAVSGLGGRLLTEAAHKTEETAMYGIGSTSKVVVSAAVMKLSEEGKIDLDRPLMEYLPEFEMEDERYKAITPRMLLDHSSGLQGSTLNDAMLLGDNDTANHDQFLSRLKKQRLKADPGTIQVYCNDGFTLAELLVERVSEMDFTEYIEKEFAEPLGLRQFQTSQSPDLTKRLAAVYDRQTGARLPAEFANVIGSGGVYATAEDLCRFTEIFMKGRTDEARLLSDESLGAMEASSYDQELNPEGFLTTLSYGLGWDSVNTAPYSQYGIKALVKGGDTNYYHASLAVLPEEGISCAVLSSGGASVYNQLAVQEIVMTYLDEIGRIERNDEAGFYGKEEDAEEVPVELMARSGWYAGKDMIRAGIFSDGRMELAARGSGKEQRQTYRYQTDGRFSSTGGSYMDSSGSLTKGSNGRIGKTRLGFQKGKDKTEYLMAETTETYPGLGRISTYIPVGAPYPGSAAEETSIQPWSEVSGTEYYLVSDKYTSVTYLERFMIKPLLLSEPEGILTFENLDLSMAAVVDGAHADFFTKVPGQAGRDLNDYTLTEEEGIRYLDSGSYRFISSEDIPELTDWNRAVTIGEEGTAVWFSIGGVSQGKPVVIETPKDGAWYLYDHTGSSMKCVSSSWTLEEGTPFYLPKDGRLAFVGSAGTVFQLQEAN